MPEVTARNIEVPWVVFPKLVEPFKPGEIVHYKGNPVEVVSLDCELFLEKGFWLIKEIKYIPCAQ